MSSLLDRPALTGRPLPASWYVDPAILARERETLLATGPRCVGHTAEAPTRGSWAPVGPDGDRLLVQRPDGGFGLLSNVCLHRGARMVEQRGRGKGIVCPHHRWTYEPDGRLCRATHLQGVEGALPAWDVTTWRGFAFTDGAELVSALGALDGWFDEDEAGYVPARVDDEVQEANWKLPLEVFLDNYHVEAIHPGFRRFVDREDVRFHHSARGGTGFSAKAVRTTGARAATPAFAAWQEAILEVTRGVLPRIAAFWLFVAPNAMIEWYPFTWVVTTYHPLTPTRTRLHSRFYLREDASATPGFADAAFAALDEVQAEDDALILALQAGRAAQQRRAEVLRGDYHPTLEDEVARFHAWAAAGVEGRPRPFVGVS